MEYPAYGEELLDAPDPSQGHPLPETLAEAERIAASIERAVQRETGGRVRDLRVEVSHRGVWLSGHCNTYYTKQMAQHAAMAVSADGPLTNQIEVL